MAVKIIDSIVLWDEDGTLYEKGRGILNKAQIKFNCFIVDKKQVVS